MALSNLKSAYSFYTKTPPGFKPNDFSINGQGTSTRVQQLGSGTKFPIGPKGQVHDFDILRGGFSIKNKYQDVYGPLSTAGLADTYTKDSPIDDMYNIVKVRDVYKEMIIQIHRDLDLL